MSLDATPLELGFRMPAEWEPHAATWLAWPHNASDWPKKGLLVEWVFVEIARCLHSGERIRLIVPSASEERRARDALRRSGVDLAQLDFFRLPTNRSWTRDSLPTFVVRGAGKRREVAAVKWRFNGWARYRDHAADDAAGESVARALELATWRPAHAKARVVLEGGAIDVDGEGSLLATEQCLLSGERARNRALGKRGTEAALREYLGIEKVLWLPAGIEGDDTSGHIDDFARFAGAGRILLCEEKNPSDPNHRVLARARARLRGAKDARGRTIEVIPLPMPAPVFFDGQRLPASYANFYVGNAAVLVPTFNDPRDHHALGLLAELFPDRDVIGVYCRDLVLGLGTLHCSTQQEPSGKAFTAPSRSENRA